MSKYAIIGDIHGCYKTLQSLIAKLPPDVTIISVGDLIDRGPSSEAVVDYFIDNNITACLGNHEFMAVEAESFIGTPMFEDTDWSYNGGYAVTQQYSSLDKLHKHIKYFRTMPVAVSLPLTHNDKPIIISHTCIDGWENICNRSIDDFDNFSPLFPCIWNRNLPSPLAKSFNIFGHTPTDYGTSLVHEPILTAQYCNIDTGCPYPHATRGYLTAVLLPSFEFIQVPRDES